jgi:hypothetical protein
MEERLRNGDGNLLSYLLATTPAVYEAYRPRQAPQNRCAIHRQRCRKASPYRSGPLRAIAARRGHPGAISRCR